MKKTTKKVIAIILCLLTFAQLFTSIASAAIYTECTFGVASEKNILGIDIERWSRVKTSFMYKYDGHIYVVNVTSDQNIVEYNGSWDYVDVTKDITVTEYDEQLKKTDEYKISSELPLWGGFFSGKTYNYLVFGQTNTEENLTKETYRIVKYDKDFNRIGQTSIIGSQCNATIPFAAGTVAMAENSDGTQLTVHTSRERFTTEDGFNHQSQFTIVLDTKTMQPINELELFQNNHVSHSFNQFVRYDGDNPVLVDHGDAYPRSIVLSKRNADGSYSELDLFEIPGATGANCTGVNVGGFEISAENYIVTINSIDHSKVTSYDSFNMYGLDKDERNAVILVSPKNNTNEENVKKIYLTDYVNKNLHATAPYLVKFDDNKFVVIWKEYKLVEETDYWGDKYIQYEENDVKYAIIDGNGNKIGQIQSLGTKCNLSDCQPIYYNEEIIWYYEASETERRICTLNLSNLGDVNLDGKINSTDALLVLQHSVQKITLTGEDFINADVDKNNTINSTDALEILKYSVGKINRF